MPASAGFAVGDVAREHRGEKGVQHVPRRWDWIAHRNLLSRVSNRLVGIGDPGAANKRKRGDFVRLCTRSANDVPDGNFSHRKRVSDKRAMASPWDCLSTHQGA